MKTSRGWHFSSTKVLWGCGQGLHLLLLLLRHRQGNLGFYLFVHFFVQFIPCIFTADKWVSKHDVSLIPSMGSKGLLALNFPINPLSKTASGGPGSEIFLSLMLCCLLVPPAEASAGGHRWVKSSWKQGWTRGHPELSSDLNHPVML